ncbi:hypothetical protein [Lysobacter silvisoli]|uniref:Uncharacterized protein n=1 Tax=Lysobacter silvisoli TaxID=2293254 RepID=A0A371K2D4_9GAMM|nr:hypothetical protein [Lysobacter silvisoli]RDZ28081.1 hypothetical protein DX914_02740 [Lysobacter silvisoli]
MKRHALWIWCIAVSLVALIAIWFVFETRYMWFVSGDDFTFLRRGSLLGVGLIILLWGVYPSRILAALAAVGIFVFPPLFRGDKFVALDIPFSAWMLGALALVVAATELNRRARRALT